MKQFKGEKVPLKNLRVVLLGPILELGPVSIVKARPIGAEQQATPEAAQGAAPLGARIIARSPSE